MSTEIAIETWIKEAKEQGRDIYDYTALKLFGVSSPVTRKEAKDYLYRHLYDGKKTKSENFTPKMGCVHACVPNVWRDNSWYYEPLTRKKSDWRTIWNNTMNPCKEIPVRQYHQYVIKIKNDEEEKEALYCVPALDARSARVLAFALYGGFGGAEGESPAFVHLEDDNIETALNWTEVIQ
jgi:hypothetical protein